MNPTALGKVATPRDSLVEQTTSTTPRRDMHSSLGRTARVGHRGSVPEWSAHVKGHQEPVRPLGHTALRIRCSNRFLAVGSLDLGLAPGRFDKALGTGPGP
jgi:hypothetical protein